MIRFHSLLEAINYIKECPLCKERLIFKKDVDLCQYRKPSAHNWEMETVLIFTESSMSFSDKIKICLQTDKVERETEIYKDTTAFGAPGTLTNPVLSSVSLLGSPHATGHKYLGVGMECPNCRNYNFMIQIVVDLEPRKIVLICLNSETLTFRDTEKTYEIRNIYTTQQTHYLCVGTDQDSEEGTVLVSGQHMFPLISLDRNDPHHFLQRVKNLLIFT